MGRFSGRWLVALCLVVATGIGCDDAGPETSAGGSSGEGGERDPGSAGDGAEAGTGDGSGGEGGATSSGRGGGTSGNAGASVGGGTADAGDGGGGEDADPGGFGGAGDGTGGGSGGNGGLTSGGGGGGGTSGSAGASVGVGGSATGAGEGGGGAGAGLGGFGGTPASAGSAGTAGGGDGGSNGGEAGSNPGSGGAGAGGGGAGAGLSGSGGTAASAGSAGAAGGGDGGSNGGEAGGNPGSGGAGAGGAGAGAGGTQQYSCVMLASECEVMAAADGCGVTCTSNRCEERTESCVDADGDGVALGPECACGETDCNDADPSVGAGPLGCYTGPTGTLGVGACAAGHRRCTDSTGVCSGQILPSAESCNGEDDDCDGSVDDVPTLGCGLGVCARIVPGCTNAAPTTCVPYSPLSTTDGCNGEDDDCDGSVDEDCNTCLHVAPDGDDAAAAASNGALAFRNVQPALDFADTHRQVATRVCVANGPSCSASATFAGPSGSDLAMHDGISLSGGYESTTWARCGGVRTTLAPTTGLGVLFPETITLRTVLDGFVIDRAPDTTTAGVTVRGASDALLVNLAITNVVAAQNSYGVNVTNGGGATLVDSQITSGNATVEGIALRSVGSRVTVTDSTLFAGNDSSDARATFFAVLLSDSPGSTIDDSSLESRVHDTTGTLAALRIVGDATDTVIRGNTVDTAARCLPYGVSAPHGISAEACGDSSPWLLENSVEIACPSELDVDCYADCRAIHTAGACHPVIEGSTIRANSSPQATGVACAAIDGTPSRCVVAENPSITSRALANPAVVFDTGEYFGYGVHCSGGSCSRITGNSIVGNTLGTRTGTCSHCEFTGVGIYVDAGSPLIANNVVAAGCGNWSTGVSFGSMCGSRIENNVIEGRSEQFCGVLDYFWATTSIPGSRSAGLAGSGDADVHSNVLSGGTNCSVTTPMNGVALGTPIGTSAGVSLGSYYHPVIGTFRDNIVFAGECTHSASFDLQVTTWGKLGALEHNDVIGGPPGVLFRMGQGPLPYPPPNPGWPGTWSDPSRMLLYSAAELNALPRSSGNISVDPLFASDGYHLLSGSPCIDAGTSTGAPARDIDGEPRDATPDIGADEVP